MTPQRKIALVTGAAKRLGREIALHLARHGWDLILHYARSQEQVFETATEIKRLGRQVITLQADLSIESEVDALIGRCMQDMGLPDCLVNSASRFEYDDANTFSFNALEQHMRINLAAPVSLARSLHDARSHSMGEYAHPAVVINLLDQKLANPNPDFLSYTLSKAALDHATILLAQALAPHVRVVGLAPGITLLSGNQTPEDFQRAHTMTVLGRSSTAEDIGNAVVYLAQAHAVTGTTLYVDGGQHLDPRGRDVMFLNT